jgi:hypothetical protein
MSKKLKLTREEEILKIIEPFLDAIHKDLNDLKFKLSDGVDKGTDKNEKKIKKEKNG